MRQRNPIHEIKNKIIYEGPEPGTLIQYFKDDDITWNEQLCTIINGKGVLNNKISEYIFTQLNKIGIQSHFIRRLSIREQLIRESETIPLRMVVRNTAAGSLSKRLRIQEGTSLPRSIVEFYYKYDDVSDTLVSEEHITAFNWLNNPELEEITSLIIRINDFMTGLFIGIGIQLVDFSIEFGRILDGDMLRIILASEIFPDCCRLWYIEEQCNKKCCIQNTKSLEGYYEIARRLGIFKINEPKLSKTAITPIRK